MNQLEQATELILQVDKACGELGEAAIGLKELLKEAQNFPAGSNDGTISDDRWDQLQRLQEHIQSFFVRLINSGLR